MTEEQRKKYELLKAKSKEKNKIRQLERNEFYNNFLNDLKCKPVVVQDDKYPYIMDEVQKNFPILKDDVFLWDEARFKNILVPYDDISEYIDLSEIYYVIWDNCEVPILKCPLKEVMNNIYDAEAISFHMWMVSESFRVLLESQKTGYMRVGIANA